MNFEEVRQEKVEEIEKILKKYLPAEVGYQKTVLEAMNYSVLAGGKRLRPMLMQETFRMFGGEGHLVEPFMAAMEMIHTYSLVHDDLPVWTMTNTGGDVKRLTPYTGKEWLCWQEMPF